MHTFAAIEKNSFFNHDRRCSYVTDELFRVHNKLVLMSYLLIITFLVIYLLFPDLVNSQVLVMAGRKLLLGIPMSFRKIPQLILFILFQWK